MVNATIAAGPATPVAVNVTGAIPLTVAVNVFVPTTVPSVQLLTCATPLEFVFTVARPMLPPPPVTAQTTSTPGIGTPSDDVTVTDGSVPETGWPAVELNDVGLLAVTTSATGGAVFSLHPATAATRPRTAKSRARDTNIDVITKRGNRNVLECTQSCNRDLANSSHREYRLSMLSDDQIKEKGLAHIARFGSDLSLSNPVVLKEPDGHFYKVIRPYSAKSTNLVSPFYVDRASGDVTSISAGDVMPGVVTKLWGWAAMRADPELQKAVIDPDFSKPRHVEVWSAIVRDIMGGKGAKAGA